MSTFGNLLIKLILDLLLSFKSQNIKRKQLIRKAKYTFFVMKLWFCMQLQLHILWKPLPLKGIFVQHRVCFDPSYIVKNQDESIRGFGLLLDRLKSLKHLPSSEYKKKQRSNTNFLPKIFWFHTLRCLRHLTFQERVNKFLDSFLSGKTFCHVHAGFYPSIFLQLVNGSKNSILDEFWKSISLSLLKYFFECLSRKTLERFFILLHHFFTI